MGVHEPEQQETAPARLGRRERNKQEKLARIVEAARQLFSTNGFAETTTQEIAEAADIGTGTLFLYAKSKEDLLVLVFKGEMIARSRSAFKRAPKAGPLIDQLMHVFNAMADHHAADITLARILLREIMFPVASDHRQDISELMEVVYGGIAALIAAKQASGSLRSEASAALAAENLFATYYMGLQVWLMGEHSREQFEANLRQRLQLQIDGLARPA